MNNITLTKEMLEYEYKNCRSLRKMSNKLCIERTALTKYMKLYNIPYGKHPTTYICNEKFFQTDTPENFYIAGFIAADGSVREQKYSKVLKIALSSNDRLHLEKIKKALNSDHVIKTYAVKSSPLVNSKNIYSVDELTITSSNIFNDLQRFNIVPNKTYSYQFPEWLINHPMVNHFMRGYIDGDGSICSSIRNNYSSKQVSISLLGRLLFLKSFNNILIKQCKIVGSKIVIKSNETYRIRYSGNQQCKIIGEFLYKNATIFLDRKFDKIKTLL